MSGSGSEGRGAGGRRSSADLGHDAKARGRVLGGFGGQARGQDVVEALGVKEGAQGVAQRAGGAGHEAGVERAVGADAEAVALVAEGAAHGSDEADAGAGAVGQGGVEGSRRAGAAGLGRPRAGVGRQALAHFGFGDKALGPLLRQRPHGHQLDEADLQAALGSEAEQVRQFMIVGAAQDDGVELDGRQSGVVGGGDARQDALEACDAGDLMEGVLFERIEADVDAAQARLRQRARLTCQGQAVGRQGQVLQAGDVGQAGDDLGQVVSRGGFAAGQPDFAQAVCGDQVAD